MFKIFFEKYPDFTIIENPSADLIVKYKNKLPQRLIDFWNNYGFGIYMNGYLKIINPDDYQEILNDAYNNTDNEIVFAITGLGDFLVWVGDAIRLIRFRYGNYNIIETGDDMDWFFDMDLAEDFFVKEDLKPENYHKAKENLGNLSFDECYGYVPLLGMGGAEKAENLQKVRIPEHISIISKSLGTIM